MASIAYYSLFCTFAFRVPILKQPGMTFTYAVTPIFIADYQVDVRLPNMHNTLKSFKNAKVVIQLYFHTSSSSIFMKFDTHKH